MFRTKTVFIVGAGGSHELGLPLGNALKSLIATKTNILTDGVRQTHGDPRLLRVIDHITRNERNNSRRDDIIRIARSMSSAMPQALSIDNYLHTRGDSPDRILIGKLAIALSILEAEAGCKIASPKQDKTRYINFGFAPHWHNTFCQIATKDLNEKDILNSFNNISIITFNYDRCIEYYIHRWIASYFDIDDITAAEVVNSLDIIHPYGQVGRLSWQTGTESSVDFGDIPEGDLLIRIAQQIRTFSEGTQSPDIISSIQERMADAVRIVFLGFSFADINISILTPTQRDTVAHSGKDLIATSKGMSADNMRFIENNLMAKFTTQITRLMSKFSHMDMSCHELMDHYSRRLES